MRKIKAIIAAGALTCASFGMVTAGNVAQANQGCVGFPSIPAAYACVTYVNPGAAVPSVSLGGGVPVTVPSACYFLDCTDETTVGVPVPVVSGGGGLVLAVYYQGQTYNVYAPVYGDPIDEQVLYDAINDALAYGGSTLEQWRQFVDQEVQELGYRIEDAYYDVERILGRIFPGDGSVCIPRGSSEICAYPTFN